MVAGPGVAGTAVASAHWFGVDIDVRDLFGHKQKKNKKFDHGHKLGANRRGGVKNSGGGLNLGTPRTSIATGPARMGDARASAGPTASTLEAPQSAVVAGTGPAPSAAVSGGGGGGAVGAPGNANIGRAPNLAPVPTAPSSRTIVIRSAPPKAAATPPVAPAPAAPVVPIAPAPVVVPPAPAVTAPVPSAPVPSAPPVAAPHAPSAPILPAHRPEPPAAQPLSTPPVPESFRTGYADYLRQASTADLLWAVLPGLGGMVLMTAVGGAVGFRQARAAQTLPAPHIARFLP